MTIVLLAANFWSIWRQRPDYLSYFNEVVQAEDDYYYLLDSNYDWGQDLKAVKKFIDANYPAGRSPLSAPPAVSWFFICLNGLTAPLSPMI